MKKRKEERKSELARALEIRISRVSECLDNIEMGDYPVDVRKGLDTPAIFDTLARQRLALQQSLPKYASFAEEKNASPEEKRRKEAILQRIYGINEKFKALAEPLEDEAMFEVLLRLDEAVGDRETNLTGITVKDSEHVSRYIAYDVHMQLDGFKEARLWYHHASEYPQLVAVDENGDKIHMRIDADNNGFHSDIHTVGRDLSSGDYYAAHLMEVGGHTRVTQFLDKLKASAKSFIAQRNPELAERPPLTFEQREIAKTNIFKYEPMTFQNELDEI